MGQGLKSLCIWTKSFLGTHLDDSNSVFPDLARWGLAGISPSAGAGSWVMRDSVTAPGCRLVWQGLLFRSPTSFLCTSPPTAVRAPSGVPTRPCLACCGLGTQVLGLSESVLIVDQTVPWESQGPPCVKSSAC